MSSRPMPSTRALANSSRLAAPVAQALALALALYLPLPMLLPLSLPLPLPLPRPLPAPIYRPLSWPPFMTPRQSHAICTVGKRWKALPEAAKAKYKAALVQLRAHGRGGMRAWVVVPALPATGQDHLPFPATPALPTASTAPSGAPPSMPLAVPPAAHYIPPLPLPADLARMFEEPVVSGAAPAAPPAPSAALAPPNHLLELQQLTGAGAVEVSRIVHR